MEQFAKLPLWGQWVAILLVCGLILVTGWYAWLSNQKQTMETRLKQVDELDGQIRQGREAHKRVDELNRQIDTILRDLELLKSIMPLDPETGKLLRVFQSYARDQNLSIKTISPKPIGTQELYSQQAYGMSVTGGYHDMALFFDKVAHMRRIVNISGLHMTTSSTKNATVDAQFNAMVYMQNPQAFQAMEKKS
jgi:type IV pilus assembly protein PilO